MGYRERQAEVLRIAKLLHRADRRELKRKYPDNFSNPPKWAQDYDCARAHFLCMARAVIADRKRKPRRAAR